MPAADFSEIKRAVKRCMVNRMEIQAGYVFGSAAGGRMHPNSDIDIAILLDERVRRDRFFDYRLKLMAEFGSALRTPRVDVIVLNQATPLLAHRVLSQGELVFERPASARVRFQVRTASRYLDLIPMFETHIRYLKKGARAGRFIG